MKAIILAAGLGKRMGDFTKKTPKPLLRVNGKNLLEHNLDELSGLVDEVIIVVGYLKEKIIDYFGDVYKDLEITYVTQEKQRGTGDALLAVNSYDAEILKNPFILLMGDDLYSHSDIQSCLSHKNSILAMKVKDPSRFGVFVVDGGLIKDIVEKPKEFVSDIVNCALYVFSGVDLPELSESARGEIEFTDVVSKLVKERDVNVVMATKWISIATPDDLKRAEELV